MPFAPIVPTAATLTSSLSLPVPRVSVSPTLMFAVAATLMFRAPESPRQTASFEWPLSDRIHRSHFVIAADVDAEVLADCEAGRVLTGTLVEPTGIVIHGPVETGANTVVIAVAAVPTSLMTRVSPSISICCPVASPAVFLTLMLVAPARAGADSPEFERPRRN